MCWAAASVTDLESSSLDKTWPSILISIHFTRNYFQLQNGKLFITLHKLQLKAAHNNLCHHQNKRQLQNMLHPNLTLMTRLAKATRQSQTSMARRSLKNRFHPNPTKIQTMRTHQLHVFQQVTDVLPSASNQTRKSNCCQENKLAKALCILHIFD